MSLSFRTNGNFIDFVNTDSTSLEVETVLMRLHNTSRCIDWSLPEDTTKISFTIDEVKYSNIPISEIDFDGTVMNSQDDFETAITGMFTGLASSPGGGGVTSVTYAALQTLISGSGLTVGQQYLISDFRTVHNIVSGNGTKYGINTGDLEPLIVTAVATNKVSSVARSTTFPQDIIHVDFNEANWVLDPSFADTDEQVIVTGWKGTITFRHDTVLDNYVGYDFRNVKFRRWKTGLAAWDSTTVFNQGSFTKHNDFIYTAIKASAQKKIDTIELSGESGTANVTAAGGLTKLVTFNEDLTTTASDFVAAHAAAYLAVGIVVTPVGESGILFTANVGGVSFTSPVITNASGDLAGTVTNTQANVAAQTPDAGSDYWVRLVDTSSFPYFLSNHINVNGITADADEFQDFKTFAEGAGDATYNKRVRGVHIGGFKDDDFDNPSTLGTLLGNNVFFLSETGSYSPYNINIGQEACENTFMGRVMESTIGTDFWKNIVGELRNSSIGNTCIQNTLATGFARNSIGNNISVIYVGENCTDNTFGNFMRRNVIGESCVYNCFETRFDGFPDKNYFNNGLKRNRFSGGIIGSLDYTDATHLYADYNCEVFKREGGGIRLKYVDSSDVVTIVAATA